MIMMNSSAETSQVIFEENMSNASAGSPNQHSSSFASPAPNSTAKKKRNLPGNPDPDAEVIALSPKSLMAINRFMCEICNKGFQRDQNLQLHRRGHNLPWKLKQRSTGKDGAPRKKAYVCPEASCVHHHPSRALGDLTGIKKHFSRKHGEKKYKCDKCSKKYAVHSDWKAHSKSCGTREYRCDCGTIFSRRDSFITHRAFCDALAEESAKSNPYVSPLFSNSTVLLPMELGTAAASLVDHQHSHYFNNAWLPTSIDHNTTSASNINNNYSSLESSSAHDHENSTTAPFPPLPLASYHQPSAAANSAHLSATALLQKAAQMGAAAMSQQNAQIMAPHSISPGAHDFMTRSRNYEEGGRGGGRGGGGDGLTRDFLGLRPPLSHKDILSMAAAGGLPCMMSSPSTFDHHCQHNNITMTDL